MKEKVRYSDFFLLILPVAAGLTIILFSEEIKSAVSVSVESCLAVIIPSLFAFMVLSSFIVNSGAYLITFPPVSFISRYIFRIPEELFSVFILSLTGGYPIGAKILTELYCDGKISQNDAKNMMMFCYAGGPTFILGVMSLSYSKSAALCVYFSSVLANVVIALATSPFREIPPPKDKTNSPEFNAEILVSSVTSGAKSLFTVCTMIIFFSVISAVTETSGILNALPEKTEKIIYVLMEISAFSNMRGDISLPTVAVLFSFGGVCVITQLFAITGGKINLKSFLAARIPAAILSYFFAMAGSIFLPAEAVCVSTVNAGIRNISPFPSIILIIMTILLLCKKTVAKSKSL